MEDQIINFKTAKLLKETLIFPYNVSNWYGHLGFTLNNSSTSGEEFHMYDGIPAPTQSHLQRCLREKYNIHIVIHPFEDGGKTVYEWTSISDLYEEEFEDDIYFPSYEEALESALQECIKLISKNNLK